MNNFIAKYFVYWPGQKLRGEPVFSQLSKLEASQFSTADEIRALQQRRLTRVLQHASKHVPFYRSHFENLARAPHADALAAVPTISKLKIRDHFDDFCSDLMPRRITRKTSGGSTGQTVTVLKDRKSTAVQRAAMYRGYRWAGIDIGDKQVRFWGVAIDRRLKTRDRFIDYFMNRIRLSAFRFSENDLSEYYQAIKSFRPAYFYGYASMLYEFARFVRRNDFDGKSPGLRTIISTSEVLYPVQRELLSAVFGCRVFNEYGCGEMGPIAFECEHGSLHINAENIIVEILKDGDVVDAGEPGEIVLTELNNLAMPLIRYRMGDVGVISAEACRCGRGLPVLSGVTGRALDFVSTADGRKIHGEYFNYLMEELQGQRHAVKQFQVLQQKVGEVTIRIVRDESFSDATLEFLRQELVGILGPGTNIKFTFVAEIERLASGKLRLVASDVE